MGEKIGGVRDPRKYGEAVNKRYVNDYVEKYVEDHVEKFKRKNDVFVSPWKVNMAGKKLSGLSIPSKSDEAATKEYADKVGNDVREYVDQSSEFLGKRFQGLPFAFLKDNGNFAAHTPISMASQPLRDLTEPKKTSDAVTKKYVDDLIADNEGVGNINGGGSPFFKENGNYQAMHAINMAFKKLLNFSTPSEPYEAATKDYVDQRPHIIAVHTHYLGNLIKDKYQFTFGGNVGYNLDTGFLKLQSGCIKRCNLKPRLKETNMKFY